MSTSRVTDAIQRLHNVFIAQDAPDGRLVEAFVNRRDPAALEALLRRHGAMVWNVCRRLVANHQDAEDAFQATFLVFVRKARSIAPREMVGNWLYGVARQTALKARALAAKRRTREQQVIEMPEPSIIEKDSWTDVQPILDQELARLPEKFRAVIILCDLEGKSRSEAAQHLGWPEGTVAGRLSRGRAALAKRLTQRGVTLSSGALAAVLAQDNVTAALPSSLLTATIKSTALVAAGNAATAMIPARIIAIADGVVKTMLLTKLKMLSVMMLLGIVLLGGGLLTLHLPAAQEADRPRQKAGDNELPQRQGEKPADKADEKNLTYAVQQMKNNLDAVSNFTCRYTEFHSSAPSLEDARQDRNVKRKARWHVLWIVRKPVERFLVVTHQDVLDQPANRSLSPIDLAGFFEDPQIGDKVRTNYLWNGKIRLAVPYDIRQCYLSRGFPQSVATREPGTPLEGEGCFNYMNLDHTFSDGKWANGKEFKVSFHGKNDDGLWLISCESRGERPSPRYAFDPKRGFLPVEASYLGEYADKDGLHRKNYFDWYATHFEQAGDDNWFTTRSIAPYVPGMLRVTDKDVHFREFKAERFDWKTKVTDDDLAITIPEGFGIRGFSDRPQLLKTKLDRKVSPAQFPELLRDLEAFEKYWTDRSSKK
jgi:RNA polymerase sigma factor (sigma-70 family)